MEQFGKFITILLAIIISSIINGFVIVKLWAWFIVPTFDQNPLRIVEAIGIMILISYIRIKRDDQSDKDFWEEFTKNVLYSVIMAGFILLIGWIVNMFM